MERYDSYKDSGVKWLGEIPSHWEMLALKHILKHKKEVVGKRSSQYDLLSLTLKGVIKRDMENPEGKFPASFDSYQAVEPNDFVFCNFDNEETPRAVGLSPYKGMITGAYDVLYRNNSQLTDKYLIYYFLYIDDAKRFKPLYKGLRKTVPFDSFMSYKIPVPSSQEQNAIVAYLDTVTSKIDAAIAQQQKMIDLLNERKQIIINNAVTKGLDPNVKMKPSGLDWIGDIPEHWSRIPIKHIIQFVNGYAFDSNAFKSEGDIPVIRISNITEGQVCLDDIVYVSYRKELEPYVTHKGDLLIAMSGATTGKVGFDTKGGLYINQRVGAIRSDYQEFVYYWLNSIFFKEYIFLSALGSAQPNISSKGISNFPICLPTENEIEEIILHIKRELEKIEPSIYNAKRHISLLQERKQIIINDVVTGKVKVV